MPRRAAPPRRYRRHVATAGQRAELSDIRCAVRIELARVAAGAAEHADLLQNIGARAFEAAGLLHEQSSAEELIRAAHDVRGLALHAFAVLAELQFYAGRMQALSALRQATESSRA
jgi:hypothetical protein